MRQVVLDTETTGLDPEQGHRIIEVGAVELIERRHTQVYFQQYLDPQRDIDEAAIEVHGLTREFLADKPKFSDIAAELLEFVRGAELIIHNAAFDIGFLDFEFRQVFESFDGVEASCSVLDTLSMARQMHPGQRNSLDALCKRYNVDNSQRTRHGALLDAEILADVYLAMTGGQTTFLDESHELIGNAVAESRSRSLARTRAPMPVIRANKEELAAHAEWVQRLDEQVDGDCLWRRIENDTSSN